MSVRMKSPGDVTHLVVQHQMFRADGDGCTVVPDHLVPEFETLGWTQFPEDDPNWVPPEETVPAVSIVDQLPGMNRIKLFATAKDVGLKITPPITNEELRAQIAAHVSRRRGKKPDASAEGAGASGGAEGDEGAAA